MPEKSTPARVEKSGDVQKATPYQAFLKRLEFEATDPENDMGNLAAETIEAMLLADSLEEAIAAQESGMLSAKDHMVGIPHQVNNVSVRKGDKNDGGGLGYYLVVEGIRHDTAEEVRYTVGASYVLTALYKAREDGRLPANFIINTKRTGSGNDMMLISMLKGQTIASEKPAF